MACPGLAVAATGGALVLADCDLLGVDWGWVRLEPFRSIAVDGTEAVVAILAGPRSGDGQPRTACPFAALNPWQGALAASLSRM